MDTLRKQDLLWLSPIWMYRQVKTVFLQVCVFLNATKKPWRNSITCDKQNCITCFFKVSSGGKWCTVYNKICHHIDNNTGLIHPAVALKSPFNEMLLNNAMIKYYWKKGEMLL